MSSRWDSLIALPRAPVLASSFPSLSTFDIHLIAVANLAAKKSNHIVNVLCVVLLIAESKRDKQQKE
jgi:hypothetical protein